MPTASTHPIRIILGLDPGYDRTGWAVGRVQGSNVQLVAFNCMQTDKKHTLHQRYLQLDQELEQVITQYQVTEAAIESLFFSKNKTTALQVAEARGFLLSTLLRHKIPVSEYNPMSVKLTVTGYGKADKNAVIKMVKLQLGVSETKARILDDTYDAMAILLTHSLLTRQSQIPT